MNGTITSRLPMDEYAALPGVSITRLKELKRSPLHYRHRLAQPAASKPLTLGTAAHCAVLEPERFERQFAVWDRKSEAGNACPRKGQHWDAFVAAHPGQVILTESEAEQARAIAAAVHRDPIAAKYLLSGEPEVTMQWMVSSESMTRGPTSIDARGRIDWLTSIDGEPVLVGLKSARDCRPFVFGSAAARLGYALQWSWYLDGYAAITGRAARLREIVVESAPPYDVVVYEIPDDIVLQGRAEYEVLLRQLVDCQLNDEWLGVAGGREQILTLPTWAYDAQDDLTDLQLE